MTREIVEALLETSDRLRGYRVNPRPRYRVDLTGRDLHGLDLSGLKLAKVDLRGASLAGASLDDADLRHCCLAEADLTGASLTGANLLRAEIAFANFTNADARFANFSHTQMDRAVFDNTRGVVSPDSNRFGFTAVLTRKGWWFNGAGLLAPFEVARLRLAFCPEYVACIDRLEAMARCAGDDGDVGPTVPHWWCGGQNRTTSPYPSPEKLPERPAGWAGPLDDLALPQGLAGRCR